MKAEMSDMLFYLAAIFVSGFAACTDLKYHKIYNKLTIPAILAGLAFNLAFNGLGGLLDGLLGILTGFLFIVLWMLGMLKAGDVKLYMAIGAITGWRFCGYVMIFSILIGGVAAAFLMAIRKTGRASARRLKEYLLCLLYIRKFTAYQPEEQSAYFSFGCCIFAGALASAWYLCFR